MIAVTGAAGFIGGRLVEALQARGFDVIGVDRAEQLACGRLDQPPIAALERDHFLERLEGDSSFSRSLRAVFHQGACVDTTLRNWRRMHSDNVEYPTRLLTACMRYRIPFIYASSAAVYGRRPGREQPLNEYGRSKLHFDRHVRRLLPRAPSPVIGLRYFNVYGLGEEHKGPMASIVFQLARQIEYGQPLRLFQGCDGYGDGEQRRDFVSVDDVVAVNLWFLETGGPSGIYDVGTGTSVTFNRIGEIIIGTRGGGTIDYVPFPPELSGRYQSFTRSNPEQLRSLGYGLAFTEVEDGIPSYLIALGSNGRG